MFDWLNHDLFLSAYVKLAALTHTLAIAAGIIVYSVVNIFKCFHPSYV